MHRGLECGKEQRSTTIHPARCPRGCRSCVWVDADLAQPAIALAGAGVSLLPWLSAQRARALISMRQRPPRGTELVPGQLPHR